jgi:hypothetical protein
MTSITSLTHITERNNVTWIGTNGRDFWLALRIPREEYLQFGAGNSFGLAWFRFIGDETPLEAANVRAIGRYGNDKQRHYRHDGFAATRLSYPSILLPQYLLSSPLLRGIHPIVVLPAAPRLLVFSVCFAGIKSAMGVLNGFRICFGFCQQSQWAPPDLSWLKFICT